MPAGPRSAAESTRTLTFVKRIIPLVIGYLLIMTGWSIANPPGASPDEYAHYLRAMGAGRGELVASEQPPPPSGADAGNDFLVWQWRQTRVVEVPAQLSADLLNCSRETKRDWGCPEVEVPAQDRVSLNTWVGTYPPFVYILPGFFMAFAETAVDALLVGRLASMMLSLILVALAALALHDGRAPGLSALGLMLAVTPMVIFAGASLTSSGPEIAAGACLAAGLLSLTRPRSEKSTAKRRLPWMAAGIGATVLMVSRDLGPIWFVLLVGVAAAFSGVRSVYAETRRGGAIGMAAIALAACGLAAAVYWKVNYQVSPEISLGSLLADLKPSFSITKEIARQQIGVFGHLDTVLPGWVYLAWSAMLIALGLLALVVAKLRERAVLLLAVLAGILLPIGVHLVQLQVGWGVQGRHVMPFTVCIPILAGEILTRHSGELSWLKKLRPSLIVGLIVGAVQGFAWYFNVKRQLIGPAGADPFWASSAQGPPVPWELIASGVGLGVVLVVLSGYLLSMRGPAELGC